MKPLQFELQHESTEQGVFARAAKVTLKGIDHSHEILTPTFMPVGTLGTVKAIKTSDLVRMQAQIILGNTYHLYLRPGHERVARFGGLHRFMNWSGPILTDSGGFQVFSLSELNKKDDLGVTFKSHLDGSTHRMTAAISMEIQNALSSDIVMAFDECAPYSADKKEVARALERTFEWAKLGLDCPLHSHQARFGIIQGGLFEDLRLQSLEQISSLPFDGLAIGGLSIGEPVELLHKMSKFIVPKMPKQKPRYLMGVGRPEDLVEGVRAGIDLFDCVMPTRNARNGQLFTSRGKINIKNARYQDDESPLDPDCSCETCTQYTKAYLRHLHVGGEVLSLMLNSIHNLTYYIDIMKQMREAILENRFDDWTKTFYTNNNAKQYSSDLE